MPIDFASFRLHQLPQPDDSDMVLSLAKYLLEAGFTERAVHSLQENFPEPNQTLTAILRLSEKDQSPVGFLVRLWLLSQKVESETGDLIFGKELRQRLIQWGLLVEVENKIAATIDLSPCQDIYLATDHLIAQSRQLNDVYPLGGDSYALARLTPRFPCKRALDLATGSGIHAILAAKHSLVAHGVDISERAVDFARFNAAFNGVSHKTDFFRGDLFSPLDDEPYDLIVSNLPWVPAPDEPVELFRGGGQDGEFLTRKVVSCAHAHLAESGWLVMYVEYPKYQHDTYLQRIQGWLGKGAWGVSLLNLRHMTTSAYVMGQVASHAKSDLAVEYERWMSSYEAKKINGMAWAMLYIKKLDPTRTNWSTSWESDFPDTEQSWVSDWLDNLDAAQKPIDPKACLRLKQGVKLWQTRDMEQAYLSWPDTCLNNFNLSPAEADVLRLLDGKTPMEEIDDQETLSRLQKLAILSC